MMQTPLAMTALWEAKAGSARTGWEDGVAYSPREGRFAVADGASTGQRSREWAYTLTSSFLKASFDLDPEPVAAQQEFARWVAAVRDRFDPESPEFPASRTPQWVRDEAVKRGAFATFLGGEIVGGSLRVVAFGDCCAFVHRTDGSTGSFPATTALDFGSSPDLVASKPYAGDAYTGLRVDVTTLGPDDLLVVASDAFAEWLIGQPQDEGLWRLLRSIGPSGFRRLVADLRCRGLMKNDDVTMLRASRRRLT